ncbi:glycosyl hydrolase family 97 [Mucilaginibacter oryzae]|uniref:Glycosyl hydrolase family 97 n=1 Tax=Mucilaginibacter oryzae TaxID=468058 RepID=A0A316HEP0_9SPHI|nr:glycoside hydrolase family 97 protein [Mucilaginibacter oryzae]PWK78867.1 glycosyl hydrolase family 97 [Mucilaginibacter oryzae]
MKILSPKKNAVAAALLCLIGYGNAYSQKHTTYQLTSPNGNIKLVLHNRYQAGNDSVVSAGFDVYYKTGDRLTTVMQGNKLGLSTAQEEFRNIDLKSAGAIKRISESYKMLTGKRSLCTNAAIERSFTFTNTAGRQLNVIFRVYNDGIAFRYLLPKWTDQPVNVKDEYTAYHIPEQTGRWVQKYDIGYENYFPYSTDGHGEQLQQWAYPALFKVNGHELYYLISEAGNTGQNSAARLSNARNLNTYRVTYPEPRKGFEQQGDVALLPWASQWHTLILGSLATVVQSTLITDVSEPSKVANPDWVVPGPAAWVYWAYNHGSKDYKKVAEYVDLAYKMNWPYVLIDWEWDEMANGGKMEDAVKYARSKGIKPMLWYNSGTTEWCTSTPVDRMRTRDKRLKEFEWLNKIEVYGVKIDFFAGDQQDMIKMYLDILKDAAEHHLMVDFHGATIPRGWSRTYPNLMTVEAVRGAEWYNNNDDLTKKAAAHNATLPFTRNVIGPMDYTPVTFSNSQHPHITSYGHELALSVVFESALQNFADRPEAFYALPDAPRNFLKTVPTAWDETRLLSGYPGKQVVIARRHGKKWYIGGLNGQDTAQNLQFNLSFIKQKSAKMFIISDGENDTSFRSDVQKVSANQKTNVKCLARGGFVCVIE